MAVQNDLTGKATNVIWVKELGKDWIKGNTDTINVYGCVEWKDKVSIDTGKFVPGTYRVNPYLADEFHKSWSTSSFVVEAKMGTTVYKFENSGDIAFTLGNYYTTVEPALTSNSVAAQGYALQKAYAKLGQNDVGLGEAIGELRSTLKMLRNPLKELADYLSGSRPNITPSRLAELQGIRSWLKSGQRMWQGKPVRPKNKASIVSAATSTWLEIRYGLLPLWYLARDVVGMVDKAYPFDPTGIHSCKANVKGKVRWDIPLRTSTFLLTMQCDTYGTGEDEYFCHASVQYKMVGGLTTAERLGLAPQFLPELAWELTTCSFVVDWWLDVGTWLGAMRTNPSIKILGNTVSTKVNRKISVSGTYTSKQPWITTKAVGSKDMFVYNRAYFKRVCNSSLPVLPTWKPEFKSVTHLIDALALIHQRAK